MAVVGIKLPGLEFENQRVEAAFRKELVYGEDDHDRATPARFSALFADVRKNYFRLFFHYMYFDVARYAYLQFGCWFRISPSGLLRDRCHHPRRHAADRAGLRQGGNLRSSIW